MPPRTPSPLDPDLRHRAQALRTAALACGSLSLFIVVFATHAAWAPSARWMGIRILLLGGGMIAFWGLIAVQTHRVCRGYSTNGNFIPRWLWISLIVWTAAVILFPHPSI